MAVFNRFTVITLFRELHEFNTPSISIHSNPQETVKLTLPKLAVSGEG